MKPAGQGLEDALREARLAEAAHLDALAQAQDANALRLDLLRAELLKVLPADSPLRRSINLSLPPEHRARLFLDLMHSVVIAEDGRSFQLSQDLEEGRKELFTSPSVNATVAQVLLLEAHDVMRRAKGAQTRWSSKGSAALGWGQIFLVWFCGLVTGAALLASYAIYMKWLDF